MDTKNFFSSLEMANMAATTIHNMPCYRQYLIDDGRWILPILSQEEFINTDNEKEQS
jgi:hypothetical protein